MGCTDDLHRNSKSAAALSTIVVKVVATVVCPSGYLS